MLEASAQRFKEELTTTPIKTSGTLVVLLGIALGALAYLLDLLSPYLEYAMLLLVVSITASSLRLLWPYITRVLPETSASTRRSNALQGLVCSCGISIVVCGAKIGAIEGTLASTTISLDGDRRIIETLDLLARGTEDTPSKTSTQSTADAVANDAPTPNAAVESLTREITLFALWSIHGMIALTGLSIILGNMHAVTMSLAEHSLSAAASTQSDESEVLPEDSD